MILAKSSGSVTNEFSAQVSFGNWMGFCVAQCKVEEEYHICIGWCPIYI